MLGVKSSVMIDTVLRNVKDLCSQLSVKIISLRYLFTNS